MLTGDEDYKPTGVIKSNISMHHCEYILLCEASSLHCNSCLQQSNQGRSMAIFLSQMERGHPGGEAWGIFYPELQYWLKQYLVRVCLIIPKQ